MRYISGYVWRKCFDMMNAITITNKCEKDLRGDKKENVNEESVLLQQVMFGKKRVVLGCVCDGGVLSGYVTGRLKMWLQSRGSVLFGSEKAVKREEKGLYKELSKELVVLQKEVEDYCIRTGRQNRINLAGILIVNQDCYLIHGGESCCYLLNRKGNRAHRRLIDGEPAAKWRITEGRIQKNVGILLGLKPFLQGVSKEAMLQCLAVQDIEREGQIDARLRELAEESRRQGYFGECSAVYVKSL